ncbi:unnamed protein product [Nippostrongylus brasiliensis]|uniref:RDD domain-containing protein n=1 Tax=Nippostrongylus brasiliensis TaxID=27835 RepID=A0A0N4XT85_NIPBR|nr:unnamed protein product [Nippostrongylus brasiliensis]
MRTIEWLPCAHHVTVLPNMITKEHMQKQQFIFSQNILENRALENENLFGFAAIFASSFIWVDSSVYFQFIYKGFGWQTLILFILVITFVFALIILISNILGKDVLGSIGKKRHVHIEKIAMKGKVK